MADYSGLLNFLQQPQTMALAQGLLQGSQPSMEGPVTFGGAFGKGLEAYNASDLKQKGIQKEEERFEKQFGLQENAQKLKAKEMADKIRANQMAVEQEAARKAGIRNALSGENPGLLNNLSGEQKQYLGILAQHDPEKALGVIGNILMKEQDPLDAELKKSKIDKTRNESAKIKQEVQGKQKSQEFWSNYLKNANNPDNKGIGADFSEDRRARLGAAALSGNFEQAGKILIEKDPSKEATGSNLSLNQQKLQAIDDVLPAIQELKESDIPYQFWGAQNIWSPNRQATFAAQRGAIVEQLMSAFNLPATGLKEAIHMVDKATMETESAYRNRLGKLQQKLRKARNRAASITPVGGDKSPPNPATTQQPEESRIEDGKIYDKRDGEWEER